MKIFDHPNMEGFKCPVCNTNEDKPVTLVSIDGTDYKGIVEAIQVHAECLDLRYMQVYDGHLIVQHLPAETKT